MLIRNSLSTAQSAGDECKGDEKGKARRGRTFTSALPPDLKSLSAPRCLHARRARAPLRAPLLVPRLRRLRPKLVLPVHRAVGPEPRHGSPAPAARPRGFANPPSAASARLSARHRPCTRAAVMEPAADTHSVAAARFRARRIGASGGVGPPAVRVCGCTRQTSAPKNQKNPLRPSVRSALSSQQP